MTHTSVLLHESIDGLAIRPGDVFVDGTLGDAGHTREVIRRHGDAVTTIGIDRDENAVSRAKNLVGDSKKHIFAQGNFRDVAAIVSSVGFSQVNKFLFDIGLSSRQLEESGRGFTFQKDEPLVMTFETIGNSFLTAEVVLNEWKEESLADIIYGFGEERYARRIAKGIAEARKNKLIKTTAELVEIILKSTPRSYHHGKIHPATRTFQALRVAVNDELGALEHGLKSAWSILASGGRIAVISFHSLEDRIVKQYFNELKSAGQGMVLTKKPITASEEEIISNPRSRSAKLRIIEKK